MTEAILRGSPKKWRHPNPASQGNPRNLADPPDSAQISLIDLLRRLLVLVVGAPFVDPVLCRAQSRSIRVDWVEAIS